MADYRKFEDVLTNQSVWLSTFFLTSSSQSVRKTLFLVNWLAATPGNSLLLSAFLPWEIVMPNHPTLEHSQETGSEREGGRRDRKSLAVWPIAAEIGGNPANQEWGHLFDEFVMKERNRARAEMRRERETEKRWTCLLQEISSRLLKGGQ